jgi:hypothetical protein
MAGALFAADPFEGTWKLNSSKTKFTQGAAPKEETLVVAKQGDDYLITITGTGESGTPISIKYTAPMKGGEGKSSMGHMTPSPRNSSTPILEKPFTAKADTRSEVRMGWLRRTANP